MSDCPIKEFASFHNHTHFSVFDGLSTPQELIQAAKDKGLKSIGLTDHGVTHGHADLYLTGKKMGVRTVFGVEAYVIHSLQEWHALKNKSDSARGLKGKRAIVGEDLTEDQVNAKLLRKKGHLVLLATNREGLSNLYQLVFRAHNEGFYGKPRMDKQMLKEHAKGLIATTACMGGVIAKRLWDWKAGEADWSEIVREAQEYDEIFGRGRFYLEIQLNEMDEAQNFINDGMVRLHRETGIPLTVTTDSHYSKQEEWEPREILHMLGWSKKTVNDMPERRIDTEIKQLYVKSPEEMWQSYLKFAAHRIDQKTMIDAFQGTLLIDSLIDDFEPDTHQRLPTLAYENPFKEMGERAIAGLKLIGLANDERYKTQLLHELNVIKKLGTANYFLIVQKMVVEARKQMLVGPGRGSAAGSLVCWALGITDMDPIQHGLMFERFCDVNRAELPDIDIDFEDPAAAKELLRKMFGDTNVASLSTYGTFQLKSLIKDLSRVYALDHVEVNKMNKQMDKELKVLYKDADKNLLFISPQDAERVSPTYNKFMEAHPDVAKQVKLLYGRIRHVGRHASAVIAGDNLPAETSIFVVRNSETGEKIVQASFTEGIVNKNLSAMGFVKFDILGLANLKVIHHCLGLVAKKLGRDKDELYEEMRAHKLDLNDMKVLKHVFWKGNFCGIFQFTNPGIRHLAQRVKPTSFDDVSAITSLYRPGPLGGDYDKKFVQCKHDPSAVTYAHPLLEDILKKTNGCLVFQEQLMRACNSLGKMSWKDVARVRKNLLKKDKSKGEDFFHKENTELGTKFLEGAKDNGMSEKDAKDFWEDILKFGNYAFNEAHSDSYSAITMQTAHLATYHPLEFYASVLTCAQAGNIQEYVSDIRKAGIKLLPVDVNSSRNQSKVEDGCIRMSLLCVDGVGPSAIEKIVAGQPYTSFLDFLDRSGVGKTPIGPLIMVGAFSSLHDCRNTKALEEFYAAYVADPKLKNKTRRQDLEELYASKLLTDNPIEDYKLHEKVFFENSLMQFSILGSPFEILDRQKKVDAMFEGVTMGYHEFLESEEETGMLPVCLKDFKEKPQRNGQMMAFMKFGLASGEEFEAPVFSTIWRHIGPKARKGSVYVTTFSRKLDIDPEALVVGKPGFAHSSHSALGAFINIDEVNL